MTGSGLHSSPPTCKGFLAPTVGGRALHAHIGTQTRAVAALGHDGEPTRQLLLPSFGIRRALAAAFVLVLHLPWPCHRRYRRHRRIRLVYLVDVRTIPYNSTRFALRPFLRRERFQDNDECILQCCFQNTREVELPLVCSKFRREDMRLSLSRSSRSGDSTRSIMVYQKDKVIADFCRALLLLASLKLPGAAG